MGIRWKSTTTIEGAIGMVAISQDIVRMSNSEPIVAETHAVRKNCFGVPGTDRHATTRRGMAVIHLRCYSATLTGVESCSSDTFKTKTVGFTVSPLIVVEATNTR